MEKKRVSRKFSEYERVSFVKEVLKSGSNILTAKKYDLNPHLLSRWVNNYRRYSQTLEPKYPKNNEMEDNYKKEYKKAIEKIKDQELKIAVLEDLLKKNILR